MSETKHTTLRLSKPTKNKLLELCELDDISMTQVINDLIVAEHRARREEIEIFRKSKKNKDSAR